MVESTFIQNWFVGYLIQDWPELYNVLPKRFNVVVHRVKHDEMVKIKTSQIYAALCRKIASRKHRKLG